MASGDSGEKTEDPTEHRRNEARKKGNIARSQDLNSAGLMLAAAFIISFFGDSFVRSMVQLLTASLKNAGQVSYQSDDAIHQLREITEFSLLSTAPILLLMVGVIIFINLLQVGVLISPEALQPKFSRINPIEGTKRLFSIRAVVKLFVSLAKLGIGISIATWTISTGLSSLIQLSGKSPAGIITSIQSSMQTLALQLAGVLFLLALLDFAFQKWKHEQDLKMTKQEVREEMKQMDGDPHMRQRRKETHQKLVQARELQDVQHADVVIKNPTHIAVALKYDPEKNPAPIVVAKGKGVIAERIHDLAIQHNVPIIERIPLARALYRDVKVGQEISLDMYDAFVEIMAYVYRLTGRTPPES